MFESYCVLLVNLFYAIMYRKILFLKKLRSCWEGTTDLLELDENELRKLLEEAVEYRSPKDRAGKSEHFQELLTSVEAEEQKNLLFFASGAGGSSSSRYARSNYNSNNYSSGGGYNNGRRSHGSRRDSTASVAEHLTHGGSLQNLAQESSLSCGGLAASHYSYYYSSSASSSTSSSYYNSGGGGSGAYGNYAGAGKRRQTRKGHPGPSVSARQREGGSLPSNVDASHTLVGPSLANFQLAFEQKKGLSEEKSVHNWFNNKEKSKSLDKPSYSKRDDKEKDRKEGKLSGSSCDIESETRDKRSSSRGKLGTNEMLEPDNSPPEYKDKQDCMVISVDDLEASGVSEQNASAALGGVQPQNHHHHHGNQQQHSSGPRSLDADDDEGTEMKVIDNSSRAQFITHASLTVSQAAAAASQNQVDSGINFSTLEKLPTSNSASNNNNSNINNNDTSSKNELPFPPYNGKLMTIGAGSTLSFLSWTSLFGPANVIKGKESSSEKAVDVNGNSVQSSNSASERNGERKKPRRKNTQEANCITYPAQKVPGHRDDNIDSLVNFIENKDVKGKKGKTSSGGGGGGGGSSSSSSIKVKATQANAKSSRSSRDSKDTGGKKREQVSGKLQKSNSLEEISKTKLEDLTAESGAASSCSNSVSSNNDSVNVVLRRSKQRSTGDTQAVDLRGDRRSWGTEASQSINYNEIGADYSSFNSVVKNESETEFHVVTSKKTKKTKKQPQGRSSSGSRAQNLGGSGGREFSNNYRMPYSPELTRKLASSVAASEKSDSSDGESNHSNRSLPATSKFESFKTPSGEIAVDTLETVTSQSANSAMQVSYAGAVTRNKPDALDKSMPVLGQLNCMPSTNLVGWPNVSSKSTSAPSSSIEQTADKLQNDHYPPLQETQKSARLQHHASAQQQQQQQTTSSPNVEKPSSPTTIPKPAKTLPESSGKKLTGTTSQEEPAASKVDIESTQQLQESKQLSGNNSSLVTSETAPIHPLPPKSPETLPAYSSSPSEIESSGNNESSATSSIKDTKNITMRVRKQVHPSQMPGASVREFSSSHSQQSHVADDSKKILNIQSEEQAKLASNPSLLQDDRDVKKISSTHSVMVAGPPEADVAKPRIGNSVKLLSQYRSIVEKTDRLPKAIKDPQPISSKESSTVFYQSQSLNYRQEKQAEDSDGKKSKQSVSIKSEKEQELPKVQMVAKSCPVTAASGASSSRPAVILLDENVTDQDKNADAETSELTFGFEVNEDLLQSEDSDEADSSLTPVASPDTICFSNSSKSYNRSQPHQPSQQPQQPLPIAFDKQQPHPHQHVRVPSYPVNAYMPVHPIPPHSAVMVQAMYVGCPVRFQSPYHMMPHMQPVPVAVVEKCPKPREDFHYPRYIAPDESHVQKFNHDKIVSFVEMAWDDVMVELNTIGRVQYYDVNSDTN
ncbi:uncharacterized protein DDB_G0284459 isoform X2 [Copidosoma floridanum]|uniref:uncharacterized protein DDB_G0284459 isoform X2 n=1 Tax=Copidosoma floridanum TaxID=29053 RepID=UPI0006C9D9DC|nr:uncharacterized protein DDB_G0284459 isoform X2 [Copidosoma floridanum]